jgi:hypothetical protein
MKMVTWLSLLSLSFFSYTSFGKEKISCKTFYKEVASEMRSMIAGKNVLPMLASLTAVDNTMNYAQIEFDKTKPGQVSSFCNLFANSLRKKKSSNTFKITDVKPITGTCKTLADKFETLCLKPIETEGKWNASCSSHLSQISNIIISNDSKHSMYFNEEECKSNLENFK